MVWFSFGKGHGDMDRYWDRTERERAGLTREQVDAMLTVELMEKGVVKVEQPEYEPVDDVKPKTTRIFGIDHKGRWSNDRLPIGFTSVELAESFSRLQPVFMELDYDSKITSFRPMEDVAIVPLDVPAVGDVANMKAAIDKATAAKKANEVKAAEYNKAVKIVNDATQGVWDDWHACREKDRRYAKIKATMAEYVGICGGNQETALTFLGKAFSAEEIAEAVEWFGSLA